MSLRSLLLGEFVRIDAPLVKYRKHDSNLSGKFTDGRDKIERMRFRLGYAHLQQLADLQKYLEKHPNLHAVAIAFELQMYRELPFEEHDIKPEKVVTEKQSYPLDTEEKSLI